MRTPIVPPFDKSKVYEPSEDTYLLLDSLDILLEDMGFEPSVCLELGSGCGIISAHVSRLLCPGSCLFLAVDINPDANILTKSTHLINGGIVDSINCDLFTPFKRGGLVDLLIFNPPYVITDHSELESKDPIYRSCAGGEMGRVVIDRCLSLIPEYLSPDGMFLLLLSSYNNPDDIMSTFIEKNPGWIVKPLLSRHVGMETLLVMMFRRAPQVFVQTFQHDPNKMTDC